MPNYDDFKKRAKATLDSLADVSVDTYKAAEEKTRVLARKTKLRAGIVNEKATIRRLSVELGTKYYEKYKDDMNSEFKQLCEEITGAHEQIALKEEEIDELKRNAAFKAEAAKAAKVARRKCCETEDADPECCESEKSDSDSN